MATKTAYGKIRIYTGGLMSVPGVGITSASVEDDVTIVYETAEAFRVDYSAKFKKEHAELCLDVVKKSDDKRSITYTVFTATDDLPPCPPTRHARYTIDTLVPQKGGLGFGSEKADVIIVEETETHYRLRFTAAFAKRHPNLCKEWVSKDPKFAKIEIVS